MLLLKGGEYKITFTAQAETIFENYVHSNQKTRRVRRLNYRKISQKDFDVWSIVGTS